MKTYEWAKLWIDMLGDRKVASLPDSSWRRFVECVLLAKELDEGGVLPPVSDMAWRLRISDDTMAADLARLAQNELVELTDYNGEERWWLPNFEKRQEKAIPDAERMRAYRKRKRQAELDSDDTVTVSERERYDAVTTRNAEKRREEKEKREEERREDAPPAPDWDTFFENNGIEEPANAEERELLGHPAAKVWLKTTGRWPTWAGLRAITSRLGPEPDAGLLREEYDLWTAAGYNPGNIAGILDRYERRTGSAGKPKRTQPQPATTGHVGGY